MTASPSPANTADAAPAAQSKLERTTVIILAIMAMGAVFSVLNETLLTVALTPIMNDFGIPASLAQWSSTGFLLVMGAVTPMAATLIQRFTTRQLYLTAMSVFVVGSIVAGFAPAFEFLLLGRLLQAFSAGILVPVLFNVMLVLVPAEQRGKVMGLIMFLLMFAPAVGPSLSGIIVGSLGWRALFFTAAPFTVINLVLAFFFLTNVGEPRKVKFDVPSFVLSAAGVSATLYAVSALGEGHADDMPLIIGLFVAGIALLALFVRRQLKADEPYLNVRIFANPAFTVSAIVFFIMGIVWLAIDVLTPIFLLNASQISAQQIGLAIFPGAFLSALLAPRIGKWFDQYGPRPLLIPGVAVLLAVALGFFFLAEHMNFWILALLFFSMLVGAGFANVPSQTNSLNALEMKDYAHGSTLVTSLQPMLGGVGIAVGVSIMSFIRDSGAEGTVATPEAWTAGYRGAILFIAVLAAIALLLSLKVKRSVPPHAASGEADDDALEPADFAGEEEGHLTTSHVGADTVGTLEAHELAAEAHLAEQRHAGDVRR